MSPLDLLVSRLFDYAGMFPPASLSLEAALKESASFPKTLKRPHLVAADMVLGLEQFRHVDGFLLEKHGFRPGRAFRICLLGSAAGSAADEAEAIERFNKERRGEPIPQEIVSYEFKLEKGGLDASRLKGILAGVRERLGSAKTLVFIEPDLSGADYEQVLGTALGVLRDLNSSGPRFGLKVREGPTGVDNEKLSRILFEVSDPPLPFKATAGLHHPIGRRGGTLGFLNLLAALLFARAPGPKEFTAARALDCLDAEDPKGFAFEKGLAWSDFSLTPEQIAGARQAAHFTIGSCSLREPDEGLKLLFG